MKQKWIIPIMAAMLVIWLGSPVEAGIYIEQDLPIAIEVENPGADIAYEVNGDIVTLTVKPTVKAGYFGINFDFSEVDYDVLEVKNAKQMDDFVNAVSVGTLDSYKGEPAVITLRNKGTWSEIRPSGLTTWNSGRQFNYEPTPAFTPSPRPSVLSLDNYPNPFNPETEIRYSVPIGGAIELTVHNMVGQTIRTLVKDMVSVGEYSINWNATDETGQKVAAGVYFYKMKSPSGNVIRKMLLLK